MPIPDVSPAVQRIVDDFTAETSIAVAGTYRQLLFASYPVTRVMNDNRYNECISNFVEGDDFVMIGKSKYFTYVGIIKYLSVTTSFKAEAFRMRVITFVTAIRDAVDQSLRDESAALLERVRLLTEQLQQAHPYPRAAVTPTVGKAPPNDRRNLMPFKCSFTEKDGNSRSQYIRHCIQHVIWNFKYAGVRGTVRRHLPAMFTIDDISPTVRNEIDFRHGGDYSADGSSLVDKTEKGIISIFERECYFVNG